MDDLISRSALMKLLGEYQDDCEKIMVTPSYWTALNMINDLPTVDAVEVVRCKDCVYYNPRYHTCMGLYLAGQTITTGYCFNGSRKKV